MEDLGRIEQTTLMTDILSVTGLKDNRTRWVYISATLHTKDEDVPIPKVYFRQSIFRYAEETSGFGVITLTIGRGDFLFRIYPYRSNLEITVKTKFLFTSGEEDESKTYTERFKAVYSTGFNPSPQMDNDSNRKIEELNTQGNIDLEFELQERFEEAYRIVTVDGAYIEQTTQTLLEATAPYRLNLVKPDNKPVVEAFYVVEPHNKRPYKNLIVPRGLLVRDFPGWLQEKGQGVYNQGIGNFIQTWNDKPTWFVYPLYDPKRFDEEDVEKLVIYFAPQDRFMGIEYTHRTEGKVTYIVTTTTPPSSDNGNNSDLDRGIGFRHSSVEAMMTKPADLTKGVIADFRKTNTEVIHNDRPDQLNFSRVVGSKHNTFLETSRVLKNQTNHIDITWDYGDPNLIYPGMPCKCVFMNQGVYEEKFGTVVSKYAVTKLIGNPMTSTSYRLDIELKLVIEQLNRIQGPVDGFAYGDPA